MKVLENQTLLYDKDCPLCNLYTTGFIKAGMLDKTGKKAFSDLTNEEQNLIDMHKASNEIALVDTKNNTVIYGIDSLLRVIGNSFPVIETIGNFKPIKFLLKKLYSFISYNRKVIIPNKKVDEKILQCIPSYSYTYRIAYVAFATMMTALTLYYFAGLLPSVPQGNFSRELYLAFGQLVFQSLFLIRFDCRTILTYAGNLMTVSLLGSLLLTPILILSQFTVLPEAAILGWLGVTILIMFAEHFRRIKLIELPTYLSYTWILYRVIALVIILHL